MKKILILAAASFLMVSSAALAQFPEPPSAPVDVTAAAQVYVPITLALTNGDFDFGMVNRANPSTSATNTGWGSYWNGYGLFREVELTVGGQAGDRYMLNVSGPSVQQTGNSSQPYVFRIPMTAAATGAQNGNEYYDMMVNDGSNGEWGYNNGATTPYIGGAWGFDNRPPTPAQNAVNGTHLVVGTVYAPGLSWYATSNTGIDQAKRGTYAGTITFTAQYN